MKNYLLLILLLISFFSFAQNNKQTIRGVIVDKLTQTPIPNANVLIISDDNKNGARSDINVNYELANAAPGRYEIKISCVGYKNVIIPNIVVNSGKETILDITMEEEILQEKEVIVTVNNKDKTINDLSTISARTFSMEEVNRYAGGRNDPARLACL
jgi:hypothetical protein